MNKKKFFLLATLICLNIHATNSNTTTKLLFSDAKQFKLDQVASAQQQLDKISGYNLPNKREIASTLGWTGALTILAPIVNGGRTPTVETAVLAACVGAGLTTLFLKDEQKEEKEKLQNFILNAKLDSDKDQLTAR